MAAPRKDTRRDQRPAGRLAPWSSRTVLGCRLSDLQPAEQELPAAEAAPVGWATSSAVIRRSSRGSRPSSPGPPRGRAPGCADRRPGAPATAGSRRTATSAATDVASPSRTTPPARRGAQHHPGEDGDLRAAQLGQRRAGSAERPRRVLARRGRGPRRPPACARASRRRRRRRARPRRPPASRAAPPASAAATVVLPTPTSPSATRPAGRPAPSGAARRQQPVGVRGGQRRCVDESPRGCIGRAATAPGTGLARTPASTTHTSIRGRPCARRPHRGRRRRSAAATTSGCADAGYAETPAAATGWSAAGQHAACPPAQAPRSSATHPVDDAVEHPERAGRGEQPSAGVAGRDDRLRSGAGAGASRGAGARRRVARATARPGRRRPAAAASTSRPAPGPARAAARPASRDRASRGSPRRRAGRSSVGELRRLEQRHPADAEALGAGREPHVLDRGGAAPQVGVGEGRAAEHAGGRRRGGRSRRRRRAGASRMPSSCRSSSRRADSSAQLRRPGAAARGRPSPPRRSRGRRASGRRRSATAGCARPTARVAGREHRGAARRRARGRAEPADVAARADDPLERGEVVGRAHASGASARSAADDWSPIVGTGRGHSTPSRGAAPAASGRPASGHVPAIELPFVERAG